MNNKTQIKKWSAHKVDLLSQYLELGVKASRLPESMRRQARSVEQLQALLQPNESLLLLLDLVNFKPATFDCSFDLYRHPTVEQGAFLIGKYSCSDFISLPFEFGKALNQYQESLREVMGGEFSSFRDGFEADINLYSTVSQAIDLGSSVKRGFWQVITPYLTGVENLAVVTQGVFHNLPLEIVCPEEIKLSVYPGLGVFENVKRCEVQEGLNIDCSSLSYRGFDLPLAKEEANLLKPFNTAQSSLLSISSHGFSDSENPHNSCLQFNSETRLTFGDLLGLQYCAKVAVISACSVGQVFDDDYGDAVSPTTALLLTGCRQVIACIGPVPDSYMPLLLLLMETARFRLGCDVQAALRLAKRHLLDWQEVALFVDLVEPYQQWLSVTWKQHWLNSKREISLAWLQEYRNKAEGLSPRGRRSLLAAYIQGINKPIGLRAPLGECMPKSIQRKLLETLKLPDLNNVECEEKVFSDLAAVYVDYQLPRVPDLNPPRYIAELLGDIVRVYG